jgi:hypothetical protein
MINKSPITKFNNPPNQLPDPQSPNPKIRIPIPASVRIAAALWVIFAIVIWNVVFDSYIDAGMAEYLRRQAFFEQGRGPEASIDAVMDDARARGTRAATGWAGAVAAVGVAGVWYASWRLRACNRT